MTTQDIDVAAPRQATHFDHHSQNVNAQFSSTFGLEQRAISRGYDPSSELSQLGSFQSFERDQSNVDAGSSVGMTRHDRESNPPTGTIIKPYICNRAECNGKAFRRRNEWTWVHSSVLVVISDIAGSSQAIENT
jgi:hypothetical protein